MTNSEIKELARIKNITYWQIANVLGVHKQTVLNRLQTNTLSEEKKEELINAIYEAISRKERHEKI